MRRIVCLICVVAAAHAVATLPALGQLQDSPWPMFHHDLQHTGRSPYIGPDVPTLKWSYVTGGVIHSSPALGADETIYVGSNDYKLYAINPNGTLKWSYRFG
jgi:hypothetical protein